jgi:hypothetical protein
MRIAIHRVLAVLVVGVLGLAGVAAAKDKAPTTVICKDGSTDEGGRGACRGHGGVDKAATKAKAGGEADKAAEAKPAKAEKAKVEEADAGAMVTCKDGSQSKGGRGACRGHGGVDKSGGAKAAAPVTPAVAPATAAKTAPATAPAKITKATKAAEDDEAGEGPATAKCKDGTLSHSKHHTGACSRHGGVAEWLDKQ